MRKAMIDDIKLLVFLIAMAIVSAIIRFKNLTQFCLDAILGFAMGYSFYLLLAYWIADGATRSGMSGIIILCSRPLYDWANTFICTKLTEMLEKRINDR